MLASNKQVTVALLSLAVILGQAASALAARATRGEHLLDRVAARVNNEIITENELLVFAYGEIGQAETLLPGTIPNVREALNSLIDERLMAQAAREEVKEIPEETITNRVEAIVKDRRSLYSNDQAFQMALEQRGWDLESFKSYLHDQEVRAYAVQAALARRVRITDQDVKTFTEELQKKGESLLQYRLRQILVALPAPPSPEDQKKAETRMLAILEQLRQGVPFEQLAREKSDDKAARVTDGDLGWMAEKDLQKPILDAVRSLERGQNSAPVRTARGIHIFQLIRKKAARDLLFEQRLAEVRKTWAADLRRRAQIKILLPQLSE
jgi:peptidyl-prolyl cis-trans isomerase SurA